MELQRREDCDVNRDYCELLASTCLAICLVLLSATDNLDTRLGMWYHDSGGTHRIGAMETRAVAAADSDREMKATENGVHERKELLKKARHALDRLSRSALTMLEATRMATRSMSVGKEKGKCRMRRKGRKGREPDVDTW